MEEKYFRTIDFDRLRNRLRAKKILSENLQTKETRGIIYIFDKGKS